MIQDNTAHGDLLVTDAGSPDEESKRRQKKIMALLRGRLHWAAAAALVLGLTGATIGYFSQPDLYSSSGRLEMRAQMPDLSSLNMRQDMSGNSWAEYVNTKMGLIRSPRAIREAMGSETWKRAAEAAGLTPENYTPEDFAASLSIDRSQKSNMINVSFTDTRPAVALAGLDASISAYMNEFRRMEEDTDLKLVEILAQRKNQLEFDRSRLETQRKTIAAGQNTEVIAQQHEYELNNQLKLQAERDQIMRTLSSQGTGEDLSAASVEELLAVDGTLQQLNADRALIEREMKRLEILKVARNHRTMLDYQSQLTMLDQQFNDRVNDLRTGRALASGINGVGDVETLKAQLRELERLLPEATARTTQLSEKLGRLRTLEGQLEGIAEEISAIDQKVQSIDTKKLIGGRLELIATGAIPTEPSNGDKRLKLAGGGFVAGGVLGVGLVMLIGLLDPRLRHIEDAEVDIPQARMLGILPTLPADLHDAEQAVLVAHSVHHIRTLLQIGREPCGNVFSISSPASGSGKTSLSMALGLSFAASGCKTLLIDSDIVGGGLTRRMGFVVHPRLGQVLRAQGLVTEPQITDALRVAQSTGVRIGEAMVTLGFVSQVDVDDALERQKEQSIGLLEACGDHRFEECVAPTGIRNLYILPIGTALPQQAGALSPSALRRVIAQARTQFDTVLIDTGPLLGSLEASMAAAEADGTVFVISRGDQKPLVQKCVQHLQAINGRLLGVVFNHALAADIARSTYGSVTVSQSRHPNNSARVEVIDADTSARFGPLATAVASYAAGASAGVRPANRRRTAADDGFTTAGAPGNGNGNGKSYTNGNGNGH